MYISERNAHFSQGFSFSLFFFQRCFDNVVHHFTIESKTKIQTKCANTIQNTCHCMCSVLELGTGKKVRKKEIAIFL